MEFSVNDAFNASAEIADSINYPNLRFFTVAKTTADAPQYDCGSKSNYSWGVSGPSTMVPVNGSSFSWFSATCYFFGRDLYRSLNGQVPIGLVASDWGGQTVETFSSPYAINDPTCGGTRNASAPVQPSPANPSNSQLWYAMIYPLLPMRFAGAVWYQGEANANDPATYACHFPSMITDWRRNMGLPLPFYFVQLAAYPSQNYAYIREAQLAALQLANVSYATAIDLGDPTSPEGSIHPRRKQEVGRRLSLNAQYFIYGQKVEYIGPQMRSWTLEQDKASGLWKATVTFDHADNLHASGTGACTQCCAQSPFQIGDGTNYVRANFTIDGPTVNLVAAFSGEATQILYAFETYPECSLYNGEGGCDDHEGIAATPFRTPPPPPVNYTLVYRQTWPSVATPQEWSLNPDDATQEMYSILNQLEDFRDGTGKFNFKLVWPAAHGVQQWKQTSNPAKTVGNVTGYVPIAINCTDNGWAGIAADTQNALLDGSWASGFQTEWWYALGSFQSFTDNQGRVGIPSCNNYAAGAVELYVRNKNGGWTLMLRQTAGTYFSPGQFSVNSDNPTADTYAALDQLENFRGADGAFEFKMLWPDRYNQWLQSSNPTTSSSVQGYETGQLTCTSNNWAGLMNNTLGQSLLKGSDVPNLWFYAIGDFGNSPWGSDGIPACDGLGPQMAAELYAVKP